MQHRTYHFGDFHLDPSTRELRRSGALVVMPPLAFDCLIYLIEHRDRAVGRDELIAAVWGRTDVTDDQLYHLVRNARRAIGERSGEQSAIRTLPRVGFRWVREVSVDPGPAAAELQSPPVEASPFEAVGMPSGGQWRTKWIAAALLFALACLLVAGGYAWHRQSNVLSAGTAANMPAHTASGVGPTEVVAVLPVEVRGVDGSDGGWIRLGLMDFIAGRLREGKVLIVPSNNVVAVVLDQGRPDSMEAKVRAATGACCVVRPTATHSGDGWSVRLQLHKLDGQPHLIEAHAKEVIDAARNASDQLLALLGKPVPDGLQQSSELLPAAEWYQRAEAAVLRDDFVGARRLLESAPEPIRSAKETRVRLASVELGAGQFEEARQTLANLLEELPAETEPLLRARVQTGLAAATLRLGDTTDVISRSTEAITRLITLQEPRYLGRAYNVRGAAYAAKGRFELAAADFASARVAFELAGDSLGVAHVEGNEGALVAALDRPAEALPLLELAAQGAQRFGAAEAQSVAVGNQITAHLQLLQPAQALAVATSVGTQFDDLRNPHWLRTFKCQRARALMANGRVTEARTVFDEFIRNSDPGEAERVGVIKGQLARLDLDAGRPDTAAILALQAVGTLSARDASIDRRMAWLVAVRALRQLDRQTESSAEVARFVAWAESSGDASAVLLAHLAEAEQAWNLGQRDVGAQKYESVLAATTTSSSPAVVAEVVSSYANALIDAGELERASAVAGQVARYADRNFACALLQVRLYHALGRRGAWQTALEKARSLAGERLIPPSLATPP